MPGTLFDDLAAAITAGRPAVLATAIDGDQAGAKVLVVAPEGADDLQVTATALKWRLVALGALKPARARAIPDASLRHNGRQAGETNPPPLFPRPFMEVIGLGIREGRVSVRRAADLLSLTIDDLEDLFAAHGVETPFDL